MQRLPVAIPAIQLPTTTAIVYTAPAGIATTVNNLSLTNTGSSPVSVTLYRVPSGGMPTVSNCFMYLFFLSPGQTYVPQQAIGLQLSSGMTLQAQASVTSAITLVGGVYETSGS